MKLQRQKLAQHIADNTSSRVGYDKLVRQVAALLLQDNQTSQLDSLLRDVRRIRADQQGFIDATVVSAHELSDDVLRDVQILLKSEFTDAKQVHISTRIESDVIGGVRIEMPDEQLDLTVRSKLAKFRHLTDAIKE